MITLQLIAIDDAEFTPNDFKIKSGAKAHTVERYLNWESAAKMLAEKINTDSMDTENFFIRFIED